MKAKVQITVVSEVEIAEPAVNEAEFFKRVQMFQKLALPGAKSLSIHIEGEGFKWDDVKARVSVVSTEVIAQE